MKKIIVDGIEYIENKQSTDIKIVILQRGWCAIGRFERNGSDCTLKKSHIIRRWGTTKGLGQLATEGKTDDTVLDFAGTMQV